MNNIDAIGHVTGKSVYLDDIPLLKGTLHAVVLGAPIAHGRITSLDVEAAKALKGVVDVFTSSDIPGTNQIGGILSDEPLLAEKEVHFMGQPLAIVVATSAYIGRQARKLILLEFEPLEAITDAREAKARGQLLFPPRTFAAGDVDQAWSQCTHIFEGQVESGAQEHLYIETQGAYAYPRETGLMIHSATQGPALVQKIVSAVLGMSMHQIEVDVKRLGGAFGGKEDQASAWAAMAGLSAFILQQPVKLVLSRQDDMFMTGKRHPYSSDFKIGLDENLKIRAWEVTYYQNGGAAADLSPAILDRTLFHATNSYFVPHVRAMAYSCKTNLPPNTAFRGFGAPQAMFVMESAIALAAQKLAVKPRLIQEKNLLNENDHFHYGQRADNSHAKACWLEALTHYNVNGLEKDIRLFNQNNKQFRKGLAMMPVCFGISFTKTAMNKAMALVHIYQDGSIGISTGAVEMGQGVNTKLKQIAAQIFSVNPSKIRIETTNTTRVANSSPTAASSGADLNGKALQQACETLLGRLTQVAAQAAGCDLALINIINEQVIIGNKITSLSWNKLVETAFLQRVNLSEKGYYSAPTIHFDKETNMGHPFTYHVYGAAIITTTIDCLRGLAQIDAVKIIHDFGHSMNTPIDMGQIEGGVTQGIGWMTMEEIKYDPDGRLLSDSLSNYKIPDIYAAPLEIECQALETAGPELAIMGSKAIGEPPLMYGIGAYFALQNAVLAFNPHYIPRFDAPFTAEKVLLSLYTYKTQKV